MIRNEPRANRYIVLHIYLRPASTLSVSKRRLALKNGKNYIGDMFLFFNLPFSLWLRYSSSELIS